MNTLHVDHTVAFDLWRDPLFWENAPYWEKYREMTEPLVEEASKDGNSLSIKVSSLYNTWRSEIADRHINQPAAVKEITDYIRYKRGNRQEEIVLVIPGKSQNLVLAPQQTNI